MNHPFDAIVLGAGPAGSSAAILLAQAGWLVAIVEKQRFPRRKVCGECIAASNLALLDLLGIGAAFEAEAGPPLSRKALWQGRREIDAGLPPLPYPARPWGRAFARERLDALLLERACQLGATVLQPWRAGAIEGRSGAFQCEASATERGATLCLTAPVLIDARGSWGAASDRKSSGADLLAFKANFCNTGLAQGLLPVISLDGGYGGMVVAGQGVATLACCIRRDRLAACRKALPGHTAGEAIQAWLTASCAGVEHALTGAQRLGGWLSAGPIAPGIRQPRRGDALFLVGNAAGEAHPLIGEGISMALQSSWLLCRLLEAHGAALATGAPESLQRRLWGEYTKAWRRQFAPRIRLAAVLARLAMRPSLAGPLWPLLRHAPGLLTQAARGSGKASLAPGLASRLTVKQE
jgi:flavin-dependent dehydrogenase